MKRIKTISQLKAEADKFCSLFVRQASADWKGECECYTCGIKKPWKEMQAGHYISRVYTNTRWYLPNLRPQCYSCNIMRHGNMDEFSARIERETPGIIFRLLGWKHAPSTGLKREDLVMLIEDFKSKIKLL